VELVSQAIEAGIFNDLGSGSNVDVCVISKSRGVQMLRNYKMPNERLFRAPLAGYNFPRGTTEIIDSARSYYKDNVVVEDLSGKPKPGVALPLPKPATPAGMDTS